MTLLASVVKLYRYTLVRLPDNAPFKRWIMIGGKGQEVATFDIYEEGGKKRGNVS